MTSVCHSLERNDLRHVSVYNSWHEVQQMLGAAGAVTHRHSVSSDFVPLIAATKHLKTFMDILSKQMSPGLDTAILWGLFGLIAKVEFDSLFIPT